jgi:hypothetical protein
MAITDCLCRNTREEPTRDDQNAARWLGARCSRGRDRVHDDGVNNGVAAMSHPVRDDDS